MFKKILISIAIVFISFLTGYATAQSFFSNTPPAQPPAGTTQNQKIMSPSDFQSQTQQLEQQKKEGLSNQLKENLSKAPPAQPPSSQQEPSAPESSMGTTEEHQGATEAKPAATPLNTPEQSSQATPGPTPTMPAPIPSQPQTNVYTGFQNQDQNQNQKQATPSSGGWNIKY